jgi:hypothetical protein
MFPNEFSRGQANKIYCRICFTDVSATRKSTIDAHRKTFKHIKRLEYGKLYANKTRLNLPTLSFTERLTSAFLQADIQLLKLRNEALKNFFVAEGLPLPSEPQCREKIPELLDIKMKSVKEKINIKRYF